MEVSIHNVVATVNLDCRLELEMIALYARNAEYNPKRFAAVVMRIREPKTTALIFASGKMVVTGAKSEDDSKLASRKYARIIQKLGFNAKFTDFKIGNIVGSCETGFPISLEELASRHQEQLVSDVPRFPAVNMRIRAAKTTALVFSSGKVVFTGAKSREQIQQALEAILAAERNQPPTILPDDDQYPVERLLAMREQTRAGDPTRQYLVRWLGYGEGEDSWVDEEDIHEGLVDDFFASRNAN